VLSLELRPTAQERTDLLAKQVSDLQTKLIQLQPLSGRGGWWPVVREPYTGAWQRNEELGAETVLAFSAVFGCTTLIMGDVGKLNMRLVELDENGIWIEAESPAFSPILRQPNRYQHWSQFAESWQASLHNNGNTYVLKEYNGRDTVRAMYVLDPSRVTPMVAADGGVFYELRRDDISGISAETVVVPADVVIHDRINCLFHPLIGMSPIFACAVAASQGLSIQNNSKNLFSNGSMPSGILTTPLNMTDETAARMKALWEASYSGDNAGRVAILSNDLKYQPLAFNAVDMQLIEQFNLSSKTVCTAYHVPPQLLDIGNDPAYANLTPYIQKYYSQCLQRLLNHMERALDNGLGLGKRFGNNYGTEFDPDDLIWMDAEAKAKAAQDGIGSGGMSPNEARKRYYSLGPVDGGETPYMQEQNWPIKMLADRELPTKAPTAPAPMPSASDDESDEMPLAASFASALSAKLLEMDVLHG
jgi:HK97 family phage portal protein